MISEKMSLAIPVLGTGMKTVIIQREKVSVEMSGNSGSCRILLKNGIGIVEPRKFSKLWVS